MIGWSIPSSSATEIFIVSEAQAYQVLRWLIKRGCAHKQRTGDDYTSEYFRDIEVGSLVKIDPDGTVWISSRQEIKHYWSCTTRRRPPQRWLDIYGFKATHKKDTDQWRWGR